MDLTTSRALGYGEGPIRWETIRDYCDEHDIQDEQREDVFYHVQNLDSVYLDWRAKRNKAEAEAKSAASKAKTKGK